MVFCYIYFLNLLNKFSVVSDKYTDFVNMFLVIFNICSAFFKTFQPLKNLNTHSFCILLLEKNIAMTDFKHSKACSESSFHATADATFNNNERLGPDKKVNTVLSDRNV